MNAPDSLAPQEALEKIRSALQLLDAITYIIRESTHAQIVIPYLDVKVTLNVTVVSIEGIEAPAVEVIKH